MAISSNGSNGNKVKILLVGSAAASGKDAVQVLHKKLESLQTSKAGPFDACFCVGTFPSVGGDDGDGSNVKDMAFPLPVYVQDYVMATGPDGSSSSAAAALKDDGIIDNTATNGAGIVQLGIPNLFYLQGDKATRDHTLQILEIKLPNQDYELVVGCCAKHVRIMDDGNHNISKQCDILLSSDWPQGMEDVVNVDTEPLSFDVAQVALQCRPRYHVAPSSLQYHQSPPYALPQSDHVGRFLALAPVVTGKQKASKSTKFIHALGLTPLSANPPPTTAPSTLPCPFVTSSSLNDNRTAGATTTTTTNNYPTKPVPGFVAAARANDTGGGYQRFVTNKKRHRDDEGNNEPISLEPPDDPNIKTVFLYGLHKDVTGQLQSIDDTDNANHKVFQAFASYGLTHVRYPPKAAATTSTYCFLEFPDQKSALSCLLDCQGRKTIDSVDLTLKWATPQGNPNGSKRSRHPPEGHAEHRHYMTEAEAPDSTTLYFHPPKDKENDDDFSNDLRQYLQATLEEALNDGNNNNNDNDNNNNEGDTETERVTAETEPALRVSVRRKDQYGFLEFASHAAATMALAAVTQRTDGGLIQETTAQPDAAKPSIQPKHLVGTTLRWAKGEPPKTKRQALLEALGLERQFFAADTRTDCWFCLASPTCETHLITGVYKDWYAAMPKGPVHPGHVLLVPVTHTRQGAWTLPSSSLDEWIALLDQMAEHASQAYDCDLFVFERAMETKGGYHSHVNCVPIPRSGSIDNTAMQLEATMMAHAKASGFDLRSIQSDLGIDALVKGGGDSSGDGTNSQYFYAEIRTRRQSHRFLYQSSSSSSNDDNHSEQNRSLVPLQFAREVLAAVLKNPKLAHWKSCVIDKDQEAQLASDFRESFTKILGGGN